MKFAAIDNTTGIVNSVFETDTDFLNFSDNVNTYVKVEENADTETLLNSYYKEGNFYTLPSKPTIYHKWNLVTEVWEITESDITTAKNRKTLDINKVRKNLSYQPIAYDDKALDADVQAQANINGKIQEIFAREAANSPLTSGEMFWKDADNVIHSWTTQNDYKFWLQGLVIAISSRNTSLYATAWTKKAEVEALTDINDIINYNENTGW